MAKSLSAIAANYDGPNEKEARRSGWDPQLEVPVVEMLGYDEQGGSAQLNRVGVSSVGGRGYLMVSGTAGGGTVSLFNDASNNRVSTFSQDAGLMRVSSIGTGSFAPLSADSSTVSAKQGDAGLLRVSAIGGTAGDNTIVDGTTQTISATLTPVSAKPGSTIQGLVTNTNSYDASQLRVSSLWAQKLDATNDAISAAQSDAGALHTSSFVDSGSISAKSGDANQLHVSSVQGDAGLMRVSAIGGTAGDHTLVDGTTQTLSATLQRVSGIVSAGANGLVAYIQNRDDASNAKVSAYQGGVWSVSALLMGSTSNIGDVSAVAGDANQLHVSAVQNDAGLLHVSAIGGTAGDNVIVGGNTQTISADVQRVSGTVSAGWNALLAYAQNRDDATNLRTSAIQSDAGLQHISAFIDSGSVSAKQGTYPWSVSGNISAAINEGTNFLGNISATIKNYPLVISGTVSAFLNQGTVSAIQPDANIFHTSAVQSDAGLQHVSAFVDSGSISARSTNAAQLVVSATQADAGLQRTSALIWDQEYTAGPNVVVSARSAAVTSAMKGLVVTTVAPDAAFNRISAIIDNGSISAKSAAAATFFVSAFSDSGTNFNVSAKSLDGGIMHVSATNPSASLFLVSAFNTESATNFLVSSVQNDAGLQHTSSYAGDANQLHTSAVQGDAGLLRVSADVFADTTGNLTIFRSISLSASQAVKATAGSIYGYFLANTDTKFNYVKFYNTSGAINVGTDIPMMTIPLPPSAGANVEYPHGLVGFTNGIGIVALSAIADNAITSSPASAVIGNIFYK